MVELAQIGSVKLEPIPTPGLRRIWWQALILLMLTAWLYTTILFRLAAQWYLDPNSSHGFFVPLFSLFVVWRDRSRLDRLSRNPSSWGLLIIAFSLGLLVLFLSRVSLQILIAGMVVLFFGWNYFRAVLFPWAVLIFMIPIPAIVFNQITLPLQMLASKVAAFGLPLFGVPVFREGNIISLPEMRLEVAEACSGIRSLVSLVTLAIIYGYLVEETAWGRIFLVLAAVPIAVLTNTLRIIGTGLLVQYWDPSKAEGFFHIFSGWLIFLGSMAMLVLLHRSLSWVDRKRRRHDLQL
jgi:exosortase